MTVDAVPVHCCLEARLVMMIILRIFFLDCGCRKRVDQMTSLARHYFRFAAVTVTPDAVGILYQRSGSMMVASGTFPGQLNVFGMVEIEWFIQFALTVQSNRVRNSYPLTNNRHSSQQHKNSCTCEPEPICLHNEASLAL
jgi:hypothetical protein